MLRKVSFVFVLLLSILLSRYLRNRPPSVLKVCRDIAEEISSASNVVFPGSPSYDKAIEHWSSSSTEPAGCAVEPGTVEDVSKILRIIALHRKPFAIKSGGHSTNLGFSSTTGIQLAMSRFSEVTYDARTKTATVGTGLVWEEVYAALEPYGVTVVGGRATGIGVGGFTLGGGYSWYTNQHGLALDNVVSYELILPSGEITTVTHESHPDLFFGLRGGLNNFGIVTRFKLRTYPQGKVWGGIIVYPPDQMQAVYAANHKFIQKVTDPKASTLVNFNVVQAPIAMQAVFYDGPKPPSGIFDEFLGIPSLSKDISARSYLSLISCLNSSSMKGMRQSFHTQSFLRITPAFLEAAVNESAYRTASLAPSQGYAFMYTLQAFLPNMFAHSRVPSAWPPSRSRALLPFAAHFAWGPASSDGVMFSALRASVAGLKNLGMEEGQDLETLPLYPNYAMADTPLEKVYGENVERLRSLKALVDPENVMGLAGGWKF